jgi:carboxylesterase type B
MEWTYEYISQFGGDREEITNWGFSAGGSQVVCSLTVRPWSILSILLTVKEFGGHYWTPPYKRAIINSPGWVPGAGHAHAEQFLENVTALVDCPWGSPDTMSCLRNVTFSTLLAASQNITDTYSYQMQPRPDGVV